MITDLAIDQALIELKRFEKALLELRAERKTIGKFRLYPPSTKNAAAKRASMDLTRKLAALRAGR